VIQGGGPFTLWEIIMTIETTETASVIEQTPEIEMLPFPYTLPNTARGSQILSVIEDHDDDYRMHVEFADILEYPESWGTYLANIALVMARDHVEYLGDGSGTDVVKVFADICSGFKNSVDKYDADCKERKASQ
jgi:hypothetical protein